MMPRCPICGVESEHMDLHESTLHTESEQGLTLQDKWDAEAGAYDGIEPRPSEKQESATPRTDAVECDSDMAALARQLERELAQAIERGRLANMRADQAEEARDAAVSAIPASAIKVLQYVSRGRDYVDIEPYPDAAAREALGEIRAIDRRNDANS